MVADDKKVKPTERLFKGLLESAPDAVVIVDLNGRIVLVNAQTEAIFGYQRQELLNQEVEILVPHRYRRNHPAHRNFYFSEPKFRSMGNKLDLLGLRKDGTEFPVEISLSPLEIENGVILVSSTIRDISDRKRADQKFRMLLESAPDAIVIIDQSGLIVLVNAQTERIFGYSRNELVGQLVEILIPERYTTNHPNHRMRYVSEPRVRPMGMGIELFGRKKDRTEFPVEISLSPLVTEEGNLVSSTIRDVTDRRQAEMKIRESLQEKEALLREIHHRVKNNLQITSSLLRLQSTVIEDPKARELFLESENRIKSMALVHEKLYQSHNLSKIDIGEYIKTLIPETLRSTNALQVKIELSIEADSILLSIDKAIPFGLIANELISNCVKHAFKNRPSGSISVNVHEKAEQVTLSVSDNGIGLPPGFQISSARTLGIRLVSDLSRQLKGNLNVVATPSASFSITFRK